MVQKVVTILYVLMLALLAWTSLGARIGVRQKTSCEPDGSGSPHRLRQQKQRYGG